jgi:hypothetical protein
MLGICGLRVLRHTVLLPRVAFAGVSQTLGGINIPELQLRNLAVLHLPVNDFLVLNAVTLSYGSADTFDLATAAFFCLVFFYSIRLLRPERAILRDFNGVQ